MTKARLKSATPVLAIIAAIALLPALVWLAILDAGFGITRLAAAAWTAGLLTSIGAITLLTLWWSGYLGVWVRSRLKGSGVRGTAEIIAIGSTSEDASVTITTAYLRVTVTGHEPYVVKTTVALPSDRAAGAQPGSIVPVWVDPRAPTRVAVDWDLLVPDVVDVETMDALIAERYGDARPPEQL